MQDMASAMREGDSTAMAQAFRALRWTLRGEVLAWLIYGISCVRRGGYGHAGAYAVYPACGGDGARQ